MDFTQDLTLAATRGTTTFDAAFERLYWAQHPLNEEPSETDDIDDWWTCVDFGAFLINTYTQDGYEAAVKHLKVAEGRTLKNVPDRLKGSSRWQAMTSLVNDYKEGRLRARLERGTRIMRILTENQVVTPRTVITKRNVGKDTVLKPGEIINDWQHRLIAVNPTPSRPTPSGQHEVTGHQFIINWPRECQHITAWDRGESEWVLPQGYTFRLDERKGGTQTEQVWTATAIPPKNISPESPMQATVKPSNVPPATLEAIRKIVKEDLARNLDPNATTDEKEEEVHGAFGYAKLLLTIGTTAQLPKTFGYYPNIEEFFDLAEFIGEKKRKRPHVLAAERGNSTGGLKR